MQVKDKVAIVTGASGGIGKATAQLLAKKGAKVVLAARSKDKLENLSKKLPNSLPIKTDMTKREDITNMVKKALEHFGKIDILVNNAGQGYDAPLENINIDTFHRIFDLDLVGSVIAMKAVIPVMRKQAEGSIINISGHRFNVFTQYVSLFILKTGTCGN